MSAAPMSTNQTAVNMEARARRAAKRVGWVARKTRWRAGSIDNLGKFAIIEPFTNSIRYGERYGERFDHSADDVIEICVPAMGG